MRVFDKNKNKINIEVNGKSEKSNFKNSSGLNLDGFLAENSETKYINKWPMINLDSKVYYTLDYFKRLIKMVPVSQTARFYERVMYAIRIHNRTLQFLVKVSPFTSFYELVDGRLWIKFEQKVKVNLEVRPSVVINKIALFKWYDFDAYRYVIELDEVHYRVKCINEI